MIPIKRPATEKVNERKIKKKFAWSTFITIKKGKTAPRRTRKKPKTRVCLGRHQFIFI